MSEEDMLVPVWVMLFYQKHLPKHHQNTAFKGTAIPCLTLLHVSVNHFGRY